MKTNNLVKPLNRDLMNIKKQCVVPKVMIFWFYHDLGTIHERNTVFTNNN